MSLDIKMNNIQTIYVYNGVDEVPMDVTHVRVDPSVTVIPEQAFENRGSLVEIKLPERLYRIEDSAFKSCRSLMRINIPSSVEEIGERAFEDCTKLEDIILPNHLRRLGGWAFCHCESLKNINIPQTIKTIEQAAFLSCYSLEVVTLIEGIEVIEKDAFSFCWSLVSIHLPISVNVIGEESFEGCKVLNEVRMHDNMERIIDCAFRDCSLVNFRMPPLVTEVDIGIVDDNNCLVSIELPGNASEINGQADLALRNIALPSECEIDENTFNECDDLLEPFPDDDDDDTPILEALQHRFDDLPIHKLCYYQSYHNNETTMQYLKREINPWTSNPPGQLNTTGKEQDCLGMTPLHILACSTKQNIEMYQLLIEKYPETLVTKDKWGDIPLLYAIWCNAPTEIIELLVESYKSFHTDYEFDWSCMIQTLAKRNVPFPNVEKLVNTKKSSFPDQEYDMQSVVTELAEYDMSVFSRPPGTELETFRYLLRLSVTKRLDLLGIKKWRIDLENSIGAFWHETKRERNTKALYDRLDMYELAKEATSILELAMWKHKMDESAPSNNAKSTDPSNKRARVDTDISERQQYRINCGSNIVVRNVLPYLLPK